MLDQIRKYTSLRKQDDGFNALSSSAVSVLTGFVFAICNGVLGVPYRSLWHGSICVYYFLLAGIRAAIVLFLRDAAMRKGENHTELRRRLCIRTHFCLLLMNLSLIVPAAVMVHGGKSYSHGLIPAIGMAAYTTYRVTMGILHWHRSRKTRDSLVSELRTINMIDALVSVLSLQNALILTNSGLTPGMQTLSAWSSGGILLLCFLLTILSLVKART